jgi:Uncharacterized virulence-associated protein D
MKKARKLVHFDLDTNLMKKYKLSRDYVYSNIKKYMEEHGFEHVQYSGYESKRKMSYYQISSFLKSLKKDLPWISPLVQDIVAANISQKYRYNFLFQYKNAENLNIMDVISKANFKPTTTLMHALNDLNNITGKFNSLKDVKVMHDNLEKCSDEEKNIVNKIVNECKRQETIEQKRQEYLGLSKNVDIEED